LSACLRERGEVPDVDEHDRHLHLLAGQVRALLQDVLGHLGVDVGAERLADPLALGQSLHHGVEAELEAADLGAVVDRHADVELPLAHALPTDSTGSAVARAATVIAIRPTARPALPRTTIATPSLARVASGCPTSAAMPMTTIPDSGSPVPITHASTARVATPGTASRSGAPRSRARTAAGRSSSSVSRYEHDAVTTPLSTTMIPTRSARAPEYCRLSAPNSTRGHQPQHHLEPEQTQRRVQHRPSVQQGGLSLLQQLLPHLQQTARANGHAQGIATAT